jgi:YVTN family beta-propeller protein
MAGTADDEREVAFEVLGPLRVTRGGVAVPLGGRQQRAVLARLLLSDGGGLSVEQLADALWGEHVPPGAAATIQTYVFRLRQTLEPDRERGAPGQVVITDSGRYRLEVPPDGLDAAVFERHLAAGQRHLAAGSPAEAVTEFDQALALWRGEVLADLADYEFVQPVAARLSDKRMAALEAKFTAELALGRHGEVIGELDEMVARFPLNEQLQRLRMVSLYRCGRPSDALAAYDRLRRQLADDVGADPSPPLQQLHQQLLTHDPALAWHPTDDSPPVATLPAPLSGEAASDVVRFGPQRVAKPIRRKRPWWRTRWLILAVLLVVVAAAGVTAIIVSQTPKRTLAAIPPNSVAIVDPNGATHDAITVGQSPTGLAYGFGSLWVANSGDNTVQRINPKTHEVIQKIDVGSSPIAVAVGASAIWVANALDSTVTKIDPTTYSTVRIPVGALPEAITAGPVGVWVANSGDDTVQRIDPATDHPDRPITVGDGPDGIALDGNTLWVANGRDRTVSHIDARTGQALSDPLDAGAGAKGIVVWRGAVWVADNAAQNVTRLDVTTGHPTGKFPVGDGPESVAITGNNIWVGNSYDGTISRIDPASPRMDRYATGASIRGMATVGSTLWVSAQAFSRGQHVGGRLTVELTNSGPFIGDPSSGLDPPTVYDNVSNTAIRPVYDGLVTFRAAGGADSLALVPDLATDLPVPRDARLTYTFFLRPNIHYSDGRTVVATDFRRGIERALIVGDPNGRPDFFYGIVGGKQCHDRPAQCNLSSGVETNDQTGRVTIHLTAADPEFLYKLAMDLVVPTPSTIPLTTHARQPIPGTGPYKIDTYSYTKQTLVLSRNPHFSEWSFAAQPAGYPDEIDWRVVASENIAVADVLAGRANYTPLERNSSLLANLYSNHHALLHAQDEFTLQYLILDTHIPPFDHPAVRQAVNYAIDRRQLVDIYGGPLNATAACRVLMPGFPGASRAPCQYAYNGLVPELDRAKEMVAASGTEGMNIGVWHVKWGHSPQLARYLGTVLTSLGYHVHLHLVDFPKDSQTFAFLANPQNHLQVDVGPGWTADYPGPATFMRDLFACPPASASGANRAAYCNRNIDAHIKAAEDAESYDLVTARARWQQTEQLILADAPIIPTVYGRSSSLTSSNVGNVQNGPLIIPRIDQMWVQG